MDMEDRTFGSPQEEINHWKNLAMDYKQSMLEAKEELDEYQISSRDLEAELEAQLEQAEGKMKDLQSSNSRLQMEVETLRERLEQSNTSSHKRITKLEDELLEITAYRDELQRYIRELEQMNDDLEQAKRTTVVSLEVFEGKLNHAIERNAFLESELDDKESLAFTVQRLKDEARDLKQELDVESRAPVIPTIAETPLDSNRLADDQEAGLHMTAHPPVTPVVNAQNKPVLMNGVSHPGATNGGTPLTPAARISALNIVGDLLRKVGALESKLASCRDFVNNSEKGKSHISGVRAANPGVNSPRSFLQQDVDLFDIFLKPAPICQLPNLMEAKSCLTLLLT
ncbi:hypothetical protein CAPTEDRAFT_2037 [Capitella teleta]|uniref:NUDE domain-containing protein n=1 Tax=Capitella teleta TaxID=283909 RepID=R7TZH9_CAPTE|nr:hypothetical protein CAPTEDRAFT_2037 [Capitella teleta]|eukprot:ELT96315.1 hypothetical protein CAPTEDRAFT_2037 [Capitella teleta]